METTTCRDCGAPILRIPPHALYAAYSHRETTLDLDHEPWPTPASELPGQLAFPDAS